MTKSKPGLINKKIIQEEEIPFEGDDIIDENLEVNDDGFVDGVIGMNVVEEDD